MEYHEGVKIWIAGTNCYLLLAELCKLHICVYMRVCHCVCVGGGIPVTVCYRHVHRLCM